MQGTWIAVLFCRRRCEGKRTAGKLIEVRSNPREDPEHPGAVKRHKLRLFFSIRT